MEITHAFLADVAKSDPQGKVNAIGIFNQVWGYDYPIQLPPCTLVVMLDLVEGELPTQRVLNVRLTGGDPEEVYIMEGNPMSFPPPPDTGEPISAQITASLRDGPSFNSPGVYTLDLFIDEDHQYSTAFRVYRKSREGQ